MVFEGIHSRCIGIHQGEKVGIYGGARLVGLVGRWDVGFLDMQIRKTAGLSADRYRELPVLPTSRMRTILVKFTYTFNIRH